MKRKKEREWKGTGGLVTTWIHEFQMCFTFWWSAEDYVTAMLDIVMSVQY